jgi:hypothetical protein
MIAAIKMKELPNGFLVESVETIHLDCLPIELKQGAEEILSAPTDFPLFYVGLCVLETIDVEKSTAFFNTHRMGKECDLVGTIFASEVAFKGQIGLIERLNEWRYE